MVNVDIDKDLYDDIKKLVKKNKYVFPSIKFFVQKAIFNELLNNKNSFDDNFNSFYSKLKEILQDNPDLRTKVDEVYSSEVKKLKKGVLQ